MGAVVGGTTGAAMAAIVMIFEMTLDYTVIIPMTLTVALSYGVRKSLIGDSIYTRKLTLRGESVPMSMRADVHFSRLAASIMQPPDPKDLKTWAVSGPPADYILASELAPLGEVISAMRVGASAGVLVMSKDGEFDAANVRGVITRQDILGTLADDLELFAG
jgi:hypothetical protein